MTSRAGESALALCNAALHALAELGVVMTDYCDRADIACSVTRCESLDGPLALAVAEAQSADDGPPELRGAERARQMAIAALHAQWTRALGVMRDAAEHGARPVVTGEKERR